jgi:hypothetical protein
MVSIADEVSDYEIAMEILYLPVSLLTTATLFFGALRLRALKGTLLLKLGFLLEIIALPLYLAFVVLWMFEDPEFSAALDAATMRSQDAIGLFLIMLCYSFDWIALVWLFRRGKHLPLSKKFKPAPTYRQSSARSAVMGTAHSPSAVLAPQLLVIAISLVIGAIVVAVGGVLVGVALLHHAGSNEFWGWMGGAIGCIVGGLGAVFGTWNSYRQLEGAGDVMRQATWNIFDRVMAGYGTIGLASLVAALGLASRLSPLSIQALLLLGGMIVLQAGLFLGIRFLARRAAQAEQIQRA